MDKRKAKKVYEISELNDPNVENWEKERIRIRYKLVEDLPDNFFDEKSKEEILKLKNTANSGGEND